MRSSTRNLFVALALAACAASTSAHQQQGTTQFQLPVPNMPLNGSITFVTLIGPNAGQTIVHARLDVTFVTEGETPAPNALLEYEFRLNGQLVNWTVTGADLGWGTGPGIFTGSIETDLGYGQLVATIPPISTVELVMAATTGGLTGKFVDSKLTLTLASSLVVDNFAISLAGGGTQTLDLDAGVANAGELYWILGSATGVSPGLPGPPALPLVIDGYTLFTLQNPNTLMAGSLGFLDGLGQATASITLPPGLSPTLAGVKLHHAYAVLDIPGTGAGLFGSNAVTLRLDP
jgi:hypothetical protein